MDNNLFENYCELIEKKTGLFYGESKRKYIELAVDNIADKYNLKNSQELFFLIIYNQNRKLLSELINSLTIKETYFFRFGNHFKLLTGELVPAILKKNNGNPIRLLSAGCSTGEEAYSLAICMMELKKSNKSLNFKIEAFDLNSEYIEIAKNGLCNKWSFREKEFEYLTDQYFVKLGNAYKVREEVKQCINFSQKNILEIGKQDFKDQQDIIFFKNVLIYFQKNTARSAINSLCYLLPDDGYLVVGTAETSFPVFDAFKTLYFPNAVIFQKKTSCEKEENKEGKTSNKIQKDSSRVIQTENENGPIENASHSIENDVFGFRGDIAQIRALIDKRDLKKALLECGAVLEKDKLNQDALYLEAVILMEMNKIDSAKNMLRKVLFLDPKTIMAHFSLGIIYEKSGEGMLAKRSYQRVQKLLNYVQEESIIPFSEGLTGKMMKKVIKTKIV